MKSVLNYFKMQLTKRPVMKKEKNKDNNLNDKVRHM